MTQVETVRGPVDVARLGTTFMHEHIFVLNEEIRQNYPADWDEEERVADAPANLKALKRSGCDPIVEPTLFAPGHDIHRLTTLSPRTPHIISCHTRQYPSVVYPCRR